MSYTVKITEGDKTVYEYTGNIVVVGQSVELEDKGKQGALAGTFIYKCNASELADVFLALERGKKRLIEKHPQLRKVYTEMLLKELISGGDGVEQYDITNHVNLTREKGLGT